MSPIDASLIPRLSPPRINLQDRRAGIYDYKVNYEVLSLKVERRQTYSSTSVAEFSARERQYFSAPLRWKAPPKNGRGVVENLKRNSILQRMIYKHFHGNNLALSYLYTPINALLQSGDTTKKHKSKEISKINFDKGVVKFKPSRKFKLLSATEISI